MLLAAYTIAQHSVALVGVVCAGQSATVFVRKVTNRMNHVGIGGLFILGTTFQTFATDFVMLPLAMVKEYSAVNKTSRY